MFGGYEFSSTEYGGQDNANRIFSATLEETVAISHTTSFGWTAFKNFIESISTSDTLSKGSIMGVDLSDGFSVTDAISNNIFYQISLIEIPSISDILKVTSTWAKTFTETITTTDFLSTTKRVILNLIETIAQIDVLSLASKWTKTLSETTWISDILKTSGNWWAELTKHTSTWTDGTKHSSTWINRNKLT